jgi:hypothetical protein
MRDTRRGAIVGSFLMVSSLVLTALPALALPSNVYSVYDEGWTAWANLNGVVDRTAALTFDSDCATAAGIGPDGDDEFHLSFRVDASSCIFPFENLPGQPVALFTWQYFDGQSQVVEFSCLDVRGQAVTMGAFEGAIEFGVAVGVESTSRTRDELVNVDMVTLVLLLPGLTYTGTELISSDDVGVLNGVNNGIFDIEISMAPCSTGLDNPDIEHYRRMAEQAIALPDTL